MGYKILTRDYNEEEPSIEHYFLVDEDPEYIACCYDVTSSDVTEIMEECGQSYFCLYDAIIYEGRLFKKEHLCRDDLFNMIFLEGTGDFLNFWIEYYDWYEPFDGIECVFFEDLYWDGYDYCTNGCILCCYINNFLNTGERRFMYIYIE